MAKESYARIGDVTQEAYLGLTLSTIYKNNNDLESAERYLIESTELIKEQDYETKYVIQSALADFYFSQKNHEAAETIWLDLLASMSDNEDSEYVSNQIYMNLGWNAYDNKNFDHAEEYFSRNYDFNNSSTKASEEEDGYFDGSYALVENRLDLVALSIAKGDKDAATNYLNQAKHYGITMV